MKRSGRGSLPQPKARRRTPFTMVRDPDGFYPRPIISRSRRSPRMTTRMDPLRTEELTRYAHPRQSEQALRHARGHLDSSSTRESFFEVQPEHYAQNILVVGFCPTQRVSQCRHRSQPAPGPRRSAGHQCQRSRAARFVRFCDCIQHPGRHLRGRARFPARHVGQEHNGDHQATEPSCSTPSAEATVPKAHNHHPQGLRRRLRS